MGAAMSDKHRAKQILLEIIRVAGGRLRNKTNLFKAFYFSHLYYAKESPGYLSDWPIVRMPNGPGIDAAPALLAELVGEGLLEIVNVPMGPFQAQEFRLKTEELPDLPLDAFEAIRRGTKLVLGKRARRLSEFTHEFSRSWNQAADGEELDIYIDLLSEDEYQKTRAETLEIIEALHQYGASHTTSQPIA